MIVEECLSVLDGIHSIQVKAICVREKSAEKGEQLAAIHHIQKVYTDYQTCLEDEEIDVVYIGIVNSMHYDYAKTALEAGKHVILEKPFVDTLKEAKDLEEIAKSRGLFLWEAITTIYLSEYDRVKELLPSLGDIHMINGKFIQYSSRYDRYLAGDIAPAFNPDLNGGALRDINIYNLHFIAGLFGLPEAVSYYPNKGYNGVDTSGIVIMDYGRCKGAMLASKDAYGTSSISIHGEKGFLSWEGAPNGPALITGRVDGKAIELNVKDDKHRMRDEFVAFENMFINDDKQECYNRLSHSMNVMTLLEELK